MVSVYRKDGFKLTFRDISNADYVMGSANQQMANENPPSDNETLIFTITRPDSRLLVQYLAWSLASLIFFPIIFPPLFFKYHTLRYRFDAEGLSMRWGLLFRREINLTYSRIQDIHVSRGILERWLGLGTVSIQTASGSSGAEMSIQGLTIYAELRDFLYRRMRGHHVSAQSSPPTPVGESGDEEVVALLRGIHEDLRAIRGLVSAKDEAK